MSNRSVWLYRLQFRVCPYKFYRIIRYIFQSNIRFRISQSLYTTSYFVDTGLGNGEFARSVVIHCYVDRSQKSPFREEIQQVGFSYQTTDINELSLLFPGRSQIIVRPDILVHIRIESSFVRLLKRCPSEYFTEIEFQLPERNEFTENIAVTSKISMWCTCAMIWVQALE